MTPTVAAVAAGTLVGLGLAVLTVPWLGLGRLTGLAEQAAVVPWWLPAAPLAVVLVAVGLALRESAARRRDGLAQALRVGGSG